MKQVTIDYVGIVINLEKIRLMILIYSKMNRLYNIYLYTHIIILGISTCQIESFNQHDPNSVFVQG